MSVTDSLLSGLSALFSWLPRLIGAVAILIIALLLARLVRGLVRRLAGRARLDERLRARAPGGYVDRLGPTFSVTKLIAGILFWIILIIGFAVAAEALGIPGLERGIGVVVAYLPNVLAAILILVVAALIAGVAGRGMAKLLGPGAVGRIASVAVPIIILTIAVFMALVQLRIATQIVVATYVIVLGSVGLGAALAFGLGGRDAARRALDEAYERGRRPQT
jgi:mechanosensitive ion channel-like protein